MLLHRYFAITVCVLCFGTLTAQIEFIAPTYNHIIAQAKQPILKKRLGQNTLPFVDDFASSGPFPNPDLWIDNQVFVNTDLAVSPPSIGVATFDGLDNTGTPYGTNESGDTLTSIEINLDVIPNDLHLSYFIQPKGFGEQPEQNDSLILEFKNDMDEWIVQGVYTGADTLISIEGLSFMFDFVMIDDDDFLHDNFQFRFRNTSSGIGAVDLWHLDVVRLLNNQVPSSTYFDVAFQNPSQGILSRFSAMPAQHFRENTSSHLRDMFSLSIFNHNDVQRPIASEESVMEITELNTGQSVLAPGQFLMGSVLNIGADTDLQIDISRSFSVNSSILNSQEDFVFETTFTIDPDMTENEPGLLNNNTIRTQTIIDDYFAYDDGIAEMSILAQGAGTNIAVEFQSSVDDTLSAISIQFPHINGDVTDQIFNLRVWLDELPSEPVYDEFFNPIYVDSILDTLQGFTTYRLQDPFSGELQPVFIPANTTFFVGWEQVNNEFLTAIPVGFDITTQNVSQFNNFSTNEVNWVTFESAGLEGAVMIRPVMGTENAIFTSTRNSLTKRGVTIYPNPNKSGVVNVKLDESENQIKEIKVFDIAGREIISREWQSNQIDLQNLSPGIYFINFVDNVNNVIYREKLIIQ